MQISHAKHSDCIPSETQEQTMTSLQCTVQVLSESKLECHSLGAGKDYSTLGGECLAQNSLSLLLMFWGEVADSPLRAGMYSFAAFGDKL